MSLPSPSGPSTPSKPPASTDDGSLASPLGRAAALMVAFLALLWVVELVNLATDRELAIAGGIRPRDPGSLVDILTAPFLHGSLEHLASNALPLFSLGFIAATTGWKRFLLVTAVIIVVGGFGVWLFSPANSLSVGASGVVFGYFGYLLLRGLVDRRPVDIVVSLGVALSYGYVMWNSIGFGVQGISWQGHIAGLIGGLLAAILFREARTQARAGSSAGPQPPPPAPST
ncbi:MAG TPA: rhomboid family intramembrane serine protease [Actinophytocola sp.]|uniref:rhomboid family intramembrane serine protease n=1 Tax=Actinophytocola sp. TaxID=1872138 RepID=UPI002DDD2884|nr:rhomboid family intramembrane serine protease [Actinophytocola sp.]HEV2780337.1 rhomboid family intramembrane serine protease [Actinophytocola sp.]